MIVEQIRYFISADSRETVLNLRRRIDRARRDSGVPAGTILLGDDEEDDSPQIVWQCGYTDEAEMGHAETRLMGNATYEEMRAELGALVTRVVLELYTVDDAD